MFDFKEFLRVRFGRPAALLAFVRAYRAENPPTHEAVIKWFQRGSIPAEWFAFVLAHIEFEEGAPVALYPFITGKS